MPIPLNQVTVAEVVMKGLIPAGVSNAVPTNFVFHYRRLAVAVNPTKAALEAIFNTTVAAPIAAALNVDWAASLHDIRWVNDAEDAYASIAATEVGAITGDRLQTFCAAYLLIRSGLRGRSFRGSKHLGGHHTRRPGCRHDRLVLGAGHRTEQHRRHRLHPQPRT